MSIAANNPKVEAIKRSVQSSYKELNELIDGPLAELEPAKLYKRPDANEWTIMEGLAHIVEFMPYWANEVEKLVEAPGQNFGRTMAHEGRNLAIREHGTDTLEQIKAALPGSYARVEAVLNNLKDSDLELTGIHSRYGERTLAWFIEEFVTGHLTGHLEQLRRCLAAVVGA